MAGAAGTLAITLSQMIEMKITKRRPSTAPADEAEKVLDVKPATEADKSKFSQEVHWQAARNVAICPLTGHHKISIIA